MMTANKRMVYYYYSRPKLIICASWITAFFVIGVVLGVLDLHNSQPSASGVGAAEAAAFHVSLPFSHQKSWLHHQNQHRPHPHHHEDSLSSSCLASRRRRRQRLVFVLHAAAPTASSKAVALKNDPWFPRKVRQRIIKEHGEDDDDDDVFLSRNSNIDNDIAASVIEKRAVLLAAELVRSRINNAAGKSNNNNNNSNNNNDNDSSPKNETASESSSTTTTSPSSSDVVMIDDGNKNRREKRIQPLVKNRFMDLACTEAGQRSLERLFLEETDIVDLLLLDHDDYQQEDMEEEDIIRGAVMVLQSLCIFAMQVGVKGSPEQLRRMVAHLDERRDVSLIHRDLYKCWDHDSVRRLKFRRSTTAAIQLLAALQWRRTTQGAFDLLVALGVWNVHEDTALLRSGFPLSFSQDEEIAAQHLSSTSISDPDAILGLRQDLTHLKVYTIDGASTSEIDDGLSLEKVTAEEDGTTTTRIQRHRLWVHIADADHWAPRGSRLLEAARKRITSLYLPTNHISMFPLSASAQIMSLRAGHGDVLALSLGVMLDENGAIDPSSIVVTPSKIRVTYRLTYDEVDELLEEGTGCREEWQLGAMLEMATLRRAHRIAMGSSEGLIPNPIPYSSVHVRYDNNGKTVEEPDISITVEMSHNAGKNKTTEVCLDEEHDSNGGVVMDVAPVSSANLLVTEAMILACEALPRWKQLMDQTDALVASAEKKSDDSDTDSALSAARRLPNQLRLPFRTQPEPDFKSRARERRVLQSLREDNIGNGLCYAWYIRRFLEPVKISETPSPHSGLGLDCYVQWSSPIRRFSDLQVHASIKRYLRRKRIQRQLLLQIEQGSRCTLPDGIEPSHLGWPDDALADKENGGLASVKLTTSDLDLDMDFLEGIGLIGAARTIQRQSQQYWMFEYIRRLQQKRSDMNSDNNNTNNNKIGNNRVIFRAVVLGCIDPERQQYAIYVPELGLEHRYVSPIRLDPGKVLNLAVDTVFPRTGLLTFVRVM